MRHATYPLLAAAVLLVAAPPAGAAPEEIQVYLDDLNGVGRIGLDLHANLVAAGGALDDYPGEQQSLHRLRVTPEFALGLTRTLEAGLYLPLATVDGAGRLAVDGAKVRLKYIGPKTPGQTWFWGANVEVGVVDRGLANNPWNTEIKGILGRRSGPWTVAVNTNFDIKLSGPAASPPSLEIATRVTYALSPILSVGVESYNGAGELRRLGGLAEHSTFVVVDRSVGRWDLELGAGAGYGANRDSLILKAIIGVPID